MDNYKIPVIYYHSIAPRLHSSWPKRYLTLPLKVFESHLKYLKSQNFVSIFIDEYLDMRHEVSTKKKCVVLTFDDGYLDNYVYAYPLLKKYGFKGTIFVNPESVPSDSNPRPSLIDYWNGRVEYSSLKYWGFLNWEEMRILEQSKVMEIQSHTMTHTKYFVSDQITGFHSPGADALYYIGNLYPERIPNYIEDPGFEKQLPYGYPIFEQESAITAHRVEINPDLTNEILDSLIGIDWHTKFCQQAAKARSADIVKKYRLGNSMIVSKENETQYLVRVKNNIVETKQIIEQKLGKRITICCWPHGDNSDFVHQLALDNGFRATTLGKMGIDHLDSTRFDRMGLGGSKHSTLLTFIEADLRVKSDMGLSPYRQIKSLYHRMKGYNS